MKKLFLIALLITSCKQPSPAAPTCAGAPALGKWYDANANDTMVLLDSCQGTDSYCGETFTFSKPSDTDHSTQVVFHTTNSNPGCESVGTKTCAFAATSQSLVVNCGQGAISFVKQ